MLKHLKPDSIVISPQTVFSLEANEGPPLVQRPTKTFRTDQSDSGKTAKRDESESASPDRFKTRVPSQQPKITLNKANIKILKTQKANQGYINQK